jgi:iron complex outermembrane receptor protein
VISRIRVRSSVVALIAGAAVIPAAPAAEEPASSDRFVLGTVEVIGHREPAALELTTETLDAETIARRQRDDLAEALDLVPGVTLQNLGNRSEKLLFVRGFSSRQVPLFIDGVPVYVPYDGNVDLSRFGVEYVSRIDVSKGLASLLYGPNILGGAINVVSRRPQGPLEFRSRVATEFDSAGKGTDHRFAASLGGSGERWYGFLSASHSNQEGYRLPGDFVPVAAQTGRRRENATASDTVINAKLGFTPSERAEYAIVYHRQDGEKDTPPYAGSYLRAGNRPDGLQVRYWRWPYWDKESVSLVSRNAIGSAGELRARVYHDRFRNALDSFDDATFTTQTRPYAFANSAYDDYTTGGGLDFEWGWSAAHVTRIAGHYKRDVHREEQTQPAVPLQRLDIPTWDAAIEHEWRLSDALSLTPSYQYVVQSGRTVQVWNGNLGVYSPVAVEESTAHNGQLVATWKVGNGRSWVVGVSRKTRFPTLKERFSGGLGSAVPNPGLEPEYATHFELAFEQVASWGSLRAGAFAARNSDAIESVTLPGSACSSPPCTQQQNVGKQRNRGLEVSAEVTPSERLTLGGQVTLLDRDNLSNPQVAVVGTPRYRYQLSADVGLAAAWRLRLDANREGRRFSNSTGTRVADAFTVVNAFVRGDLGGGWGVSAGVRNLFDELHAYDEGFFEPGRTALLQVEWRYGGP